jgi:hypothetical protein
MVSDLVADELHGDGGGIEEFVQGDANVADTFIGGQFFQ